jgi:hypothetical protein
MAFERAAEKGVLTLHQPALYILDSLARRGPLLWETAIRSDYQPA